MAGSLKRLGVSRITLLQLHNSITTRRGDEPTSVSPNDVLSTNGVLRAFLKLQDEGVVDHIGFGDASHVDDALTYPDAGPLPAEVTHKLASSDFRTVPSETPR